MKHSTRQRVSFLGNSYSQLAILSNPFANIGVFLIRMQQDQGSRILPVLEPSLSERRQVAACGQPRRARELEIPLPSRIWGSRSESKVQCHDKR
jgi:hypothetical protein